MKKWTREDLVLVGVDGVSELGVSDTSTLVVNTSTDTVIISETTVAQVTTVALGVTGLVVTASQRLTEGVSNGNTLFTFVQGAKRDGLDTESGSKN